MLSEKRSKRSPFRGFRRRLRLLVLVVGSLTLLFGALFLVFSPLARPPQRAELVRYGSGMAAAGLALLALRIATGTIPDWIARRRSPSLRRRREEYARRATREVSAKRSGGALILMLILVGLIAALLVQSHALARARAARETAARERALLRQAAVEAAREALQRLADDEDLAVDAAAEPWAAPLDRETPLGIATRVRVRDEQARVDLNNLTVAAGPGQRAAEDILLDLKTLCGDFSPAARVAALRDFIDPDSAGSREADFYRRLDPPRRCADRALYGWRELTAVDGWSESLLARRPRERIGSGGFDAPFVDHAALIPAPRARPIPVNVNTASRETLRAVMGLEQDRLVDMVLTLRAIRPIRQLDVFIVTAGPETFDRLRPHLDVRSRHFRIHARAEWNGRRYDVEALAVRADDGRVRIAQWVEDDLT